MTSKNVLPLDAERRAVRRSSENPPSSTIPTQTRNEGGLPRLEITRSLRPDGTGLRFRVAGEIDLATAPALAREFGLALRDIRSARQVTRIVVDLRPVTFLGAAGLGELARAHGRFRDEGVVLLVVAAHRVVVRPLRLTGLDRCLGLWSVDEPTESARS